MLKGLQEIFNNICMVGFAGIGAITILFICGVYMAFLFEIIPNKWQEYRERRQKVRRTNAHTN